MNAEKGSHTRILFGAQWEGDDWKLSVSASRQAQSEQQLGLPGTGREQQFNPGEAATRAGPPAHRLRLAFLVAAPVPRGAVVAITHDGETEPVTVRLGVWLSNTKSRRDKLTAEQLAPS